MKLCPGLARIYCIWWPMIPPGQLAMVQWAFGEAIVRGISSLCLEQPREASRVAVFVIQDDQLALQRKRREYSLVLNNMTFLLSSLNDTNHPDPSHCCFCVAVYQFIFVIAFVLLRRKEMIGSW